MEKIRFWILAELPHKCWYSYFFAAMLTGNSLIQPERFSISNWWEDINETEATIFHYLGVIIAVLLSDQSATKASLGN